MLAVWNNKLRKVFDCDIFPAALTVSANRAMQFLSKYIDSPSFGMLPKGK